MKQKQSLKAISYCFLAFVFIAGSLSFFTTKAQPILEEEITIYLKNNSLLPKKFTLVSYRPYRSGNGTNGFVLLPLSRRKCMYPAGSKLYLASSQQVDTVMSGNRLQGKPFLIVKEADEGNTFIISE